MPYTSVSHQRPLKYSFSRRRPSNFRPSLLQHAGRGGVVGDAPRPDAMHFQFGEAELHDGARRFRGVAVPPVIGRQFVADVGFVGAGGCLANAAVADEPAAVSSTSRRVETCGVAARPVDRGTSARSAAHRPACDRSSRNIAGNADHADRPAPPANQLRRIRAGVDDRCAVPYDVALIS